MEKNHTLYVNRINEKIKIPELKEKLRDVFGKFGTILEVVAGNSLKKKGQAFIVFDKIEDAEKALTEMQNYTFEGSVIRVNYAKGKSDAIAKLDGTHEEQRLKRRRSREEQLKLEEEERARKRRKKEKKKKDAMLAPNKILFVENISTQVKANVSNTLLFKNIFLRMDGCKDVRYIPQKNVAFVEFESENDSIVAVKELNKYQLFDRTLAISFSKI